LLAGQYAFILHYFSKKLLDCSFTAKIERCPAWDASIRRIGVVSVSTLRSTLGLKRPLLISAHHVFTRYAKKDAVGAHDRPKLGLDQIIDMSHPRVWLAIHRT
jgi:hypothetical protein